MNDLLIRTWCYWPRLFHVTWLRAAALATSIRDHAIMNSWPLRFLGWLLIQLLLVLCGLLVGILFLFARAYFGIDEVIYSRQVF